MLCVSGTSRPKRSRQNEFVPPTLDAALISTDVIFAINEKPYQRIPSERFELSRLSAHASEACVSTSSTKRARCRRAKPRAPIARHRFKRSKQIRHTLLIAKFLPDKASSNTCGLLKVRSLSPLIQEGNMQGS